MFTGIIEEVGTIKQIQKNPASAVLTIAADTVLEQTKIGDSIAVNGVCLTVTDLKAGSFILPAFFMIIECSRSAHSIIYSIGRQF